MPDEVLPCNKIDSGKISWCFLHAPRVAGGSVNHDDRYRPLRQAIRAAVMTRSGLGRSPRRRRRRAGRQFNLSRESLDPAA